MPEDQSHFRRLERSETAAQRLHLSPEDEAEVRFLIEQHLEMSATIQRRDVFDPLTVVPLRQRLRLASASSAFACLPMLIFTL